MNKIVKGVLLGGFVGAAIGTVQVVRETPPETVDNPGSDDAGTSYPPPEPAAPRIARAAAQGALVGGFVGLLMFFRARRRARQLSTLESAAERTTKAWRRFSRRARPAVEAIVETAAEAYVAAKPRVEHAAEVALEKAAEAYVAAKPRVEHAAEVAREKASEAYVAAKPRVEHAAEVAFERASDAADVARERAAEARERLADLRAAS
jgi:hypothetical protein